MILNSITMFLDEPLLKNCSLQVLQCFCTKSNDEIKIVEVGPRDGLQNEKVSLSYFSYEFHRMNQTSKISLKLNISFSNQSILVLFCRTS